MNHYEDKLSKLGHNRPCYANSKCEVGKQRVTHPGITGKRLISANEYQGQM